MNRFVISAQLLACVLSSGVYSIAGAQTESVNTALEEVVVTARKRTESLMSTPVSITAFSASTLDDMNITSTDQIADQTPGLVFDSTSNISGSANSSSVFIRGIGQRDYTLAVEPGVGIYVDDVYLAHSIGNVIDVVDVERIEVLRGPQGTLFGRNTIGGAVRVVTKKPSDETQGLFELTLGEFNRRDIKGQFNLPLSDNFFWRVSALSQQNDGFVDRPFLSGKTGDKDSTTVISQARWLANDNVTADLLLTYSQDRSNGAPVILLKALQGQGNPALFARQVAPSLNPSIYNYLHSPGFVGWDGENCPCIDRSNTDIPQDMDTWSAALTVDWQMNESMGLKSITAFRDLRSHFGRDADHLPENQNAELYFYTEYQQFSQELQLSGSSEQLDWLVGLYYYKEDGSSDDYINFVSLDLLSGGGFETEDYAVFSQASWHVSDKFDVTLGLRYTNEEKTAIIDGVNHQVVTAFLGRNAFKVPNSASFKVVPAGTYVESVSETEPYINLSYDFNDDLMTYLSYSEGFKGGGIQVRNGPTPFLPIFGPEYAKVVELGAKWSAFDGRMNISSAVFKTDYTDLQITANVTPPGPNAVPTSVVTNAGDAEIKGFELELSVLPIAELQINAGVSVLDGKYTKLLDAPGISLQSDLPNAPELQWNMSVAYEHATTSGFIKPRVDYSYSDEQYNDASNSESLKRESVKMLNLSIAYETAEPNYKVALFVKNALDEQVVLAGFDGGFYADGAISRPREWGIKFTKLF